MDHTPTPDERTVIPTADARALSLYKVEERARHYARESRAANTRRAYRADWADFTAWCQAHGRIIVDLGNATRKEVLLRWETTRNGTTIFDRLQSPHRTGAAP